MNLFDIFHDRIDAILSDFVAAGKLVPVDPDRFVVEPPRDSSLGDLACNAAMVLAKEAKPGFGAPRAFAEAICERLIASDGVAAADVAGPGFINIRLQPALYADVLRAVLRDPENYGRSLKGRAGALQGKVNVEYVSANPTGPMHVGHGRGAVFGDALANLLAFSGCEVTREYYINDAGAQVDVLARSAFLRYREALGESITIPEGLYPGDYLRPVGEELARRFGGDLLNKPEHDRLSIVKNAAIDGMMEMIRSDLAALNIRHDHFFSERTLHAADQGLSPIDAAIDWLRGRGLVYEGRLPPPKGQLPDDWEDREQTLFKSTDFGDDVDRALRKSNGSPTYFAADIAYHKDKIDRGYDTLVDVWGADHGGYVKRMNAAVSALSEGSVKLDVKLCQLVRLMRNGEPVKMSKRAGDFVTLREVVNEVGVDAVRFMMLFRKNDAPLDFDLAKVIEQSRENPVFYVQYAHARAKSVLRQAAAAFPDFDLSPLANVAAPLHLLTDESEKELGRAISHYPRVIEAAAAAHEPHRIAFYLHDLASLFHSHWNRGKDQPSLRFVNAERRDATMARISLVLSVIAILVSGLGILGVSAPDEMR